MQGLCIHCRKWTKAQSPPSRKEKSQTLVPLPIPIPPHSHHYLRLGIANFAPIWRCDYLESWRLLVLPRVEGGELLPCESNNMCWGRGSCGHGRWSEPTRGWGTAGDKAEDTTESSHTGCSNHTPAEPFPKCKIWSSPNGTKTGYCVRNLKEKSHLWRMQWAERRWVYKPLSFPRRILLRFLLQQLRIFWCLQHTHEQTDTLTLVTTLGSPSQLINVNYWHWILTEICVCMCIYVFIYVNIYIHASCAYVG